jgi:glycosyltransferase involved in cell wall biosynthesis
MEKVKLEIIIPVRMPCSFLNSLRCQLSEYSEKLTLNYVLDCNEIATLEDLGISKVFPNESFIVGKFGSPGMARNEGLKIAKAEFVCFWDVDDTPVPGTTLEFLEEMIQTQANLGIGNWSMTNNSMAIRGNSVIEVGSNPGLWRFVFRREDIQNIEFSEEKWGEDQLFIAGALSSKPKIITTKRVLYRYKKGNLNSLTSQHENFGDLFKVNKKIAKIFGTMESPYKDCVAIILLKQLFTIFKYGGVFSGLKALTVLILQTRLSIIISVTKLIFTKRNLRW